MVTINVDGWTRIRNDKDLVKYTHKKSDGVWLVLEIDYFKPEKYHYVVRVFGENNYPLITKEFASLKNAVDFAKIYMKDNR